MFSVMENKEFKKKVCVNSLQCSYTIPYKDFVDINKNVFGKGIRYFYDILTITLNLYGV